MTSLYDNRTTWTGMMDASVSKRGSLCDSAKK